MMCCLDSRLYVYIFTHVLFIISFVMTIAMTLIITFTSWRRARWDLGAKRPRGGAMWLNWNVRLNWIVELNWILKLNWILPEMRVMKSKLAKTLSTERRRAHERRARTYQKKERTVCVEWFSKWKYAFRLSLVGSHAFGLNQDEKCACGPKFRVKVVQLPEQLRRRHVSV